MKSIKPANDCEGNADVVCDHLRSLDNDIVSTRRKYSSDEYECTFWDMLMYEYRVVYPAGTSYEWDYFRMVSHK